MLSSTEFTATCEEASYMERAFVPCYGEENGDSTTFLHMKEKKKSKVLATVRAYLNSYMFYVLQIIVALFFVWLKQEVWGAVFFGALLLTNLVICDDIRATTLPFLIICTITTNRYNSYSTFIVFAKYAPIALVGLIYHFVVYPKKFVCGESAKGIFAVSIAVCFGGMGRFSLETYVYGAYYFFGLGFGMLLVYFLLRSQFGDDTEEGRLKFAFLMTLMGVLCAGMIANGYYKLHTEILPENYSAFSRNNLSTILMFAMPFPLYLAKKWKFAPVFSVITLCALSFTGSRGGFIFGCVEFVACTALWIFSGGTKKSRKVRLIAFLSVIAVLAICLSPFIVKILKHRFEPDLKSEMRFLMMREAFMKFLKRPISGYGLLDSEILYESVRKKGSLTWYHMMVPQVIGGMGLIGVFCYAYQCVGRIRLALTKPGIWSLVLGISYLGVLMMSQVNPGEFCPLPFEFLAVLLFVMQETRLQTTRPLFWDKSK